MMTILIRILAFVALVGLVNSPVWAAELCKGVTSRKPIAEARAAAVKAGYPNITEMDEEGGCYEARGLNPDGSRFEVHIHPTSLKIVKILRED